jgi:hypothetical protein
LGEANEGDSAGADEGIPAGTVVQVGHHVGERRGSHLTSTSSSSSSSSSPMMMTIIIIIIIIIDGDDHHHSLSSSLSP